MNLVYKKRCLRVVLVKNYRITDMVDISVLKWLINQITTRGVTLYDQILYQLGNSRAVFTNEVARTRRIRLPPFFKKLSHGCAALGIRIVGASKSGPTKGWKVWARLSCEKHYFW